jgi:acyl-[acyl-carrier-protein]-phospholipid O-acyltransferase/long-chain-fatty-acid--[acyl-carrier-protein] ligase
MSGGTILLATPSFLRAYLRRCTRANFATLEAILVGAERLPRQLTGAFEEKFGVRPVEGYGCTETSPLVSSNIPPSRSKSDLDLKEGTVGRPVPGVRAKVTALASSEELGPSQQGMLWVKGPNVMKGYLGREDKTAEVIQNGWYRTGDVVLLDEDGFITIVGRESRFAKIMGEMVPLDGIETALNQIIGVGEDEGQKASVIAVPDEKTGERLVVVHTPTEQTPEDLRQALLDEGLSYIYVPPVDSFLQVDDLPMLGTGKLDHKSIRQMAEAILFPAK